MTHDVFCRLLTEPEKVPAATRAEVARLGEHYNFFHWNLAFPDVFHLPAEDKQPENDLAGWSGGFDVVLGNPPWERLTIHEKEWFAERHSEISKAKNAAARKQLIAKLRDIDSALYCVFSDALRHADAALHMFRDSGRYPLCGRGDANTYTIFAELNRSLIQSDGRVGCIVPSGIATDDTTKHFFRDLMECRALVSLYSFENEEFIFPNVHHATKFCLMTICGIGRKATFTDFVFFLTPNRSVT